MTNHSSIPRPILPVQHPPHDTPQPILPGRRPSHDPRRAVRRPLAPLSKSMRIWMAVSGLLLIIIGLGLRFLDIIGPFTGFFAVLALIVFIVAAIVLLNAALNYINQNQIKEERSRAMRNLSSAIFFFLSAVVVCSSSVIGTYSLVLENTNFWANLSSALPIPATYTFFLIVACQALYLYAQGFLNFTIALYETNQKRKVFWIIIGVVAVIVGCLNLAFVSLDAKTAAIIGVYGATQGVAIIAYLIQTRTPQHTK